MILLRAANAAFATALVALAVIPARADVLEVGDGEARWLNGPHLAAPPAGDLAAMAAAEVPADMPALPDHAVAQLARHGEAIPQAYAAKVAELAARFDLSPALIEALVWQESCWRPDARSPVGARGLAQLMPGTARYLGVDPDDPHANLEGGARYLREQIDRFDGDLEKALAAYNAGPGRVIRAGGIPRIRETQNYVAAVMGRLSDHSRSTQ